MANEFPIALMRATVANLHFLCAMTCAREMYGKSYFSLGLQEKDLVDQTVLTNVGSNFRALTPQFLADEQKPQAAGFRASMQAAEAEAQAARPSGSDPQGSREEKPSASNADRS